MDYNVSRGTLALISAISLMIYGIFQPIFGRLSDYWGARLVLTGSMGIIGISLILIQWLDTLWVLALVYGILISIGYAGTSNVIASAIVIHWFHKKQGLALGFVTSGMAVGQMLIVPLSIFMVNNWHWKMVFLIFGAVVLFVITPLILLIVRSKPKDLGLLPYGETNNEVNNTNNKDYQFNKKTEAVKVLSQSNSVYNLFKLPTFWLLLIPHFFCGFTDLGLINTHLIPYLEGRGFFSNTIALTISLLALCNITGTLIAGYISDYVNRTKLLAFLYITRAAALLLLFYLPGGNIHQLIIFAVLFGITDMAPVAIVSSLCVKLFGRFSIGVVIGMISASHQFGAAVGSFLPGLLYDWMGDYKFAMMLSIGILISIAVLILFIRDERKSILPKNLEI